jgi:hypothetical protein
MPDYSKTGPLTIADLTAIWTKAVDPSYGQPFLDVGEGGGLEVYTQAFAQYERVSKAVDTSMGALFIRSWSGQSALPAAGAQKATVQLTFARSGPLMNAPLVLAAGSTFVEEQQTDSGDPEGVAVLTGRRFVLTQPLVFEPGDQGPFTVTAIAEFAGYGYNNPRPGSLNFVDQPGTHFYHPRANVTVVPPAPPTPTPPNASAQIVTPNEVDTFIPDHVGQYVRFGPTGPNLGLVARIVGFQPPDLTVPRGSVVSLGMDLAFEAFTHAGTFQAGEPVTFKSGVTVKGTGILLGSNPNGSHLRVTLLVLTLDPGAAVTTYTLSGNLSGATANIDFVLYNVAQTILPDTLETSAWVVLDWATDWGLTVTNVSQPTGGVLGMLDALGEERNIARGPNETDDSYRSRVAEIADVVTPNAVRRALTRVMNGQPFCFREVGSTLLPGFYFDIPDTPGAFFSPDFYDTDVVIFNGALASGVFLANERVSYQDSSANEKAHGWFGRLDMGNTRLTMIRTGLNKPKPAGVAAGDVVVGLSSGAVFNVASITAYTDLRRFREYLDYVQFRAFFLVGVPQLGTGEFGFAYDTYPTGAYDLPPPFMDFYDGFPYLAAQFYLRVFQAVDRVRAGGVTFDLYLTAPGETCT